MSDTPSGPSYPGSPLEWTRRVLRSAWNDLLSVYYANTPIWRVLKSGALIALGLFCWIGANLLLSYRADWGWLYYVMAYGFALLLWGPLTHLVIVPAVVGLRRSGPTGVGRIVARHGSKLNLSVFLLIVLVLGTAPLGVMTFEFQAPSGGPGGEVTAQLQCTRSGGVVHCHLSDARGVGSVVVTTGGREVTTVTEPPYDFDLEVDSLQRSNGDRQFTVELRDENGVVVRRYVRRTDLIPG